MASIGDLTEKSKELLEGLVTCPVCMDPLTSPKTLICDHSFCKQCLADMLGARFKEKDTLFPEKLWIDHSIECPTCRKTHCGLKSISDLRTNQVVTQLSDYYHRNKEHGTGLQSGQCCCGNLAMFACLRCETKYCKTCLNNMSETNCMANRPNSQERDSVKSKHFIVRISDCHGSDSYRCKEHDLSLDYFCTLCKDPVCMDCFITKHYSHTTITIKAATKDAMDMCFHLKSLHAKSKASRKPVEEKAQEVFEKIANNEKEVLELLQKQHVKMQNIMTCLFDKAKVSCTKVFAKYTKDVLLHLPEAIESDTYDSRIHSLVSLIHNPKGNDLQVASNISNLHTALMQCQQKAEEIEAAIQLVKKEERDFSMLEHSIPLRINQGKIFRSMVELFSNITLDPHSVGKIFPTGITFEEYDMDDIQYHNMTTDSTTDSKAVETPNKDPQDFLDLPKSSWRKGRVCSLSFFYDDLVATAAAQFDTMWQLESFDKENHVFLKGADTLLKVAVPDGVADMDSTWRIVPGVSGKGFSFQSVRSPQKYISIREDGFTCLNAVLSSMNMDDFCFFEHEGLADPKFSSFESCSKSGFFLQSENLFLKISNFTVTAAAKARATWKARLME